MCYRLCKAVAPKELRPGILSGKFWYALGCLSWKITLASRPDVPPARRRLAKAPVIQMRLEGYSERTVSLSIAIPVTTNGNQATRSWRMLNYCFPEPQ